MSVRCAVVLAQYHLNNRGARDRLNQLLIDEFLEHVELTPSHHLIASLPLHTVWTTNYDDLLETAFEAIGKRVDAKRRSSDFSTTRRRAHVAIYKMHGDKTDPAEAVLTKEDYETYNPKRELFTIALKGDLTMKTFLFIGVSFADPNVQYLLSRVKQLVDKNGRQHFCLLKPPKAGEYEGSDYDARKFPHLVADLRRYNIQPILVDAYSEVPIILQELNRRSHLRDVFISGSAADFAPLGEVKFRELCRALGKVLIKSGYNLVSGYGLGVGGDVIVGAMQALNRNDDERLQLWPFPQDVPVGVDKATFWKSYRERMISSAGVCLVLSGNKLESGAIVPAGGVRQEVEITRAQGKVVLPIGSTGHVARELWNQVISDPKAVYGVDVSKQLAVLGDEGASVAAIVQAVVEFLKAIDK